MEYAKKLVAKTHNGPQNATIILKGVFNSATGNGKIRASALKQYGLLEGETDAYNATPLARAINSAPPDELAASCQQSCLAPKAFKTLFDTFHNDKVSRAKIRQQALALDVHPDSANTCVELFIQSLQYAGLATLDGEDIVIAAISSANPPEASSSASDELHDAATARNSPGSNSNGDNDGKVSPVPGTPSATANAGSATNVAAAPGMNVTLNLDSTMDPEKLERQLKLLRQYGVLK